MKLFLTLACALLLSLSGSESLAASYYRWPDPAQSPRVIINASQSIEDYIKKHPEWFTHDALVTDLTIHDVPFGEWASAFGQYRDVRTRLEILGMQVGTYVSGTTAIPDNLVNQYPQNAVSVENLPAKTHFLGAWIREPVQTVVDLKDAPSRQALQNAIAILWKKHPAILRFVDNAAVHPRVARLQAWEYYCSNMSELRAIADRKKARLIFNVFVRPWELTDVEMKQLISGVGDGAILLPLSWSKAIKDDKNANGWAIYRYRQLLDNGIAVIVTPSPDAPLDDLLAWLATWRKPKDLLYVATTYTEPPLTPPQ